MKYFLPDQDETLEEDARTFGEERGHGTFDPETFAEQVAEVLFQDDPSDNWEEVIAVVDDEGKVHRFRVEMEPAVSFTAYDLKEQEN